MFLCPADHVPDWQPRILLGIMVEARSVNVKNVKKPAATSTTIMVTNRYEGQRVTQQVTSIMVTTSYEYSDRQGFNWKATALKAEVWVETVTEGGRRFMAAWRKEEVDAARHRQEKREATRLGTLLSQTGV